MIRYFAKGIDLKRLILHLKYAMNELVEPDKCMEPINQVKMKKRQMKVTRYEDRKEQLEENIQKLY